MFKISDLRGKETYIRQKLCLWAADAGQISLYEARPERCAGGAGKGQFCGVVINSNLISAVMIDHFFGILIYIDRLA